MTITRNVYSTEDLLGVYRDLEPIQDFWLQFFPGMYESDREKIEWSKITDNRFLAPLVVPTATGEPVYAMAEELQAVKPAYLKPKDTVQAAGMLKRRAGLGEIGQLQPLSPAQRYDAAVAEILRQHRMTIERRWEWMAAKALLNGSITLVGDKYPEAVVDFRRAANQTIVLGGGSRWGDSGVSIVDDIDSWNDRMADAAFGGPATNVIVTRSVWKVMKADEELMKLLNKDIRNTSGTSLDLGVGNGDKIEFKGNISANLRLWVYGDYYHDADGTVVPFMEDGDILMVGTAVNGVKGYGAILDEDADFQPAAVFPKMWPQQDPSGRVIMTQSAPLMIPLNPNNTLKATVVVP